MKKRLKLTLGGAPLAVVAKRLDQASPNVTLAIYSHAPEADELAAAKIWNDAMRTVVAESRQRNRSTPAKSA